MNRNKNTKKIIITMFLVISMAFSMFSNVYAEDMKGTITLSLDSSSSYKVGGTVVINVDLSVSGFDGVQEFLADVEYDKQVLKYTGINPSQGWSVNSSNDNIYIERKTNATGRLCQIKFEVLKAVSETTVQLTNTDTAGSNGQALSLLDTLNEPAIKFKTEPKQTTPEQTTPGETTPGGTTPEETKPEQTTPEQTKPEQTKPEETKPEQTTPEQTKPEQTKPGATTQEQTKTQSNKPKTTVKEEKAPTRLPQTGYTNFAIILIGMMSVVLVVTLIQYIKYTKEIK